MALEFNLKYVRKSKVLNSKSYQYIDTSLGKKPCTPTLNLGKRNTDIKYGLAM